ncbi:MAG: hypothetical protein SFU83_02800 [Meiothermus sp.]|nr:hypothetical protein [Meiothermus sp.]
MRKQAVVWVVIALIAGGGLADSPNESKMTGEELARSVVGLIQAEPPNLEMAQDRLKDALEKAAGLDANALKLAQQALQAGVPQAVPPLVAKAVGDDPAQAIGGKPVEVNLGPGLYAAFAIGLLLVFLGAFALGRNASLHPRSPKGA